MVGAGRTEVCQTLFGIEQADQGNIFVKGTQTNIRNPQDAIKLGIGYLPEDRQKQGLVLDWDIGRNITLSNIQNYAKHGWLSEAKKRMYPKLLAEKVGGEGEEYL